MASSDGLALRQVATLKFRIVGVGRVRLGIVGAARQQLGEPMIAGRRPGAERDESEVRLLPRRGPQRRDHALAGRRRPLCRLIGQHQHRGEPVRPLGVGADHFDARAGLAVLDTGLLRRVLYPPAVPVAELVDHERPDVIEAYPRLGEAGRDYDGLAPRDHQRPVQCRRRDPGQQRRLAVAARDRQRRRLDALGERPGDEAPLPGEHRQPLAGRPALGDGQPGQVSLKRL